MKKIIVLFLSFSVVWILAWCATRHLYQDDLTPDVLFDDLDQNIIVAQNSWSDDLTYDVNIKFFLVNIDESLQPDDPNKLVAISKKVSLSSNSIESKIEESLNSLFEIKTFLYWDSEYSNYLYKSDLSVDVITEWNKIVVLLEWKIMWISLMWDYVLKKQITKTIEEYTTDYIIKLNNSESERNCALDASWECDW